jgi:hypothetical protein
MKIKKFALKLLFPHPAIIVCLLPISIAFLVFSLIHYPPESLIGIFSYLVSFYVLVVMCLKLPKLIRILRKIKKENKFLKRWFTDVHFRVNAILYGTLCWNVAFAILQLWLGFYHNSLWFYSMFAYYTILGVMRFFLVKHTRTYKANQEFKLEIKKYLFCGWLLLLLNVALAIIIFFIVYWNKTFNHNVVTAIAFATYTFTTFTFAIINLIKYRKYKSPVYTATKIISLIAGCVSMITLETTLISTFGNTSDLSFRQLILSITGACVIIFALTTAIIMIVKGHKFLKKEKHFE